MAHTDTVVDNSLTTFLNDHTARLAAQPAGFIPLPTADADMGQIAVVEDDGTLLYTAGVNTLIDEIAVLEKFYQSHGDLYDFVCIFSSVPNAEGSVFTLVHSLTTGVTTDVEDNRDVVNHGGAGAPFHVATGPLRNLKAFTRYVDLTQLPVNPNALIPGNNDNPLSLIAQEIGHYWGIAALYETVPGGAISNGLQGRGSTHWSFFMHSNASSMEGNAWTDNGGMPNSFTSNGATNNYSPFDLYLMGFLDPALTPDTFRIEVPSADTVTATVYLAGSQPRSGANITGVRTNVTIAQVVAGLGPRNPDFHRSQKDFKTAFILVVANADTAPANAAQLAASVAQLDGYRAAWEAYWNAATGGASTMDTGLATPRVLDLFVRDNLLDDGSIPTVDPLYYSPDIITRKNPVPNPATAFGDPTTDPGSDRVEIGNDNHVYVRVHNRGDHPGDADVELYYAALTTAIDPATWNLIGTTTVPTVPAGWMAVSSAIVWPSVPDPGGAGHFCLIAVVSDPLDPRPNTAAVVDVPSYLDFIRNNNNVAYRNLTFENVLADSDADSDFVIGKVGKIARADLVFDAAGLPAGFQAAVLLPPHWQRQRLELQGFKKAADGALLLAPGKKGVIFGAPLDPKVPNRVGVRIRPPREAAHGTRAALAVAHEIDRHVVGRVEFRTRVVDRRKARYLGVKRSGLFYPARDKRIAALANAKLRPFDSIGEALQWGFDPAPETLVGVFGPKAVSAKLARSILDDLNAIGSARELVELVRSTDLEDARAFGVNAARRILTQRKRLGAFETLDQVAGAPGVEAGAFAALVDSYKVKRAVAAGMEKGEARK